MNTILTASGTVVMPAVAPDFAPHGISADLSPIIPCEEPDDDDRAQVLPALPSRSAPAWARSQLLPSFEREIALDPVVLPVTDVPRLAAAALASIAYVGAIAAGLWIAL